MHSDVPVYLYVLAVLGILIRFNADRDSDQGIWWPKVENFSCLKNLLLFWSKIAIYLSLGLHEGRLSYRRSLQTSKNIQNTKTAHFITFFFFCLPFFPPLIRNRIRIQLTARNCEVYLWHSTQYMWRLSILIFFHCIAVKLWRRYKEKEY